nr:integrase, catalytic region, zinc finger, CCHC-type, peptidase aspartic, catalytic [Tanacetum cinerariifolium]
MPAMPKADHSKSPSSFSDHTRFFYSTCDKCVFNANHTACITKLLKEVNSRAKIQSHKTRDHNKPVDQKSHTQIPRRQIFTRHKFSPNKTSTVYEKISPRSDLRWKPTGRIFKSVGLRWLPTGKLFDSCTNKVESEPPHGSNIDISKIHECKQTLDLSAGKSQSMATAKADISETIVKVDSQMMKLERRLNKMVQSSDGENLDKMKEKGDECIFVGYSNQSKAYRVFNKRTRVIMESIHVNFDELPLMASDQNSFDPAPECQTMTSDQNSSDPAPECQTMALNHDSLSPAIQRQGKVTQADRTVTTSNELDLLFRPMFDELLNGSLKVVSMSSAVSAADASNQRQQLTTPLTNHTTHAPTCQILTLTPTVISFENINQAETYAENDQVTDDEFINTFSNPVQDQGETSTRHVNSSNMHTFYQRCPLSLH